MAPLWECLPLNEIFTFKKDSFTIKDERKISK